MKVGHCQAFIAQTPCRARGRGFFACSFYEPPWPFSRSERLGRALPTPTLHASARTRLRPSTLTAVQSVWASGEASGITRASGPLHRYRLLQRHLPKAFRSPAGRAAWRRGLLRRDVEGERRLESLCCRAQTKACTLSSAASRVYRIALARSAQVASSVQFYPLEMIDSISVRFLSIRKNRY